MKKTILNLFAIAAIGLAVSACGGHHEHEHEHDRDDQDQSTTVTTTTTTTETEHHHEGNKESKETPAKSEVPTENGAPTADTSAPVKAKDESTMGSTPTTHHVKPGGVH